jgi:hypothetical protein
VRRHAKALIAATAMFVLLGASIASAAAGPPQIGAFSVSNVDLETAILHAEVNPSGADTGYHFEYVDQDSFEASGFTNAAKAPAPDGDAGASEAPQALSRNLTGLAPDTKYEFRVVASNSVGTVTSGAKSFRTFANPEPVSFGNFPGQGFLPDNRAWELVSPPQKNGGAVLPTNSRTRAAADGSAVGFTSLVSFGDAIGTGTTVDYMATRSSDADPGDNGWATHAITPPQAPVSLSLKIGGIDPFYGGDFSPNLDVGIFLGVHPLTEDPDVAGVFNLYRRSDLRSPGAGSYDLLSACPLCPATDPLLAPPSVSEAGKFLGLVYRMLRTYPAGNSPDFGHVLFESRYRLTADAPLQPESQSTPCKMDSFPFIFLCRTRLYEWDHGTVRLAGRVPTSPAEPSCDDSGGPACIGADVSIVGGGSGFSGGGSMLTLTPHVISDGSDGHSRIFFTQPTNSKGEGSGEAEESEQFGIDISLGGRLYVRVDHSFSEELNASERETEPEDAFAPATYRDASVNGERVFFTTSQALTDDAPVDSDEKLYLYDASKPGSDAHNLSLISTEVQGFVGASEDGRYAYFIKTSGEIDLWHEGALTKVATPPFDRFNLVNDNFKQARLTPDGRHLLFSSSSGAGLLSSRGGEDYDQECHPGIGCKELYVYDADSDSLQCASCNPSGAPATVDAEAAFYEGNLVGGSVGIPRANHALSDDGRYAFFTTAERLVPRDNDGTLDAYVYDTVTGRRHLLSSGEDPSPSYFMDASSDGRNAFILTRQRLSGWDVDSSYDLYDARVNGGFPEPPLPPTSCIGDACQPAPVSLNDPTPASASFAGAGNQRRVRKHHKHKRRRHQAKKHRRDVKHNRGVGR